MAIYDSTNGTPPRTVSLAGVIIIDEGPPRGSVTSRAYWAGGLPSEAVGLLLDQNWNIGMFSTFVNSAGISKRVFPDQWVETDLYMASIAKYESWKAALAEYCSRQTNGCIEDCGGDTVMKGLLTNWTDPDAGWKLTAKQVNTVVQWINQESESSLYNRWRDGAPPLGNDPTSGMCGWCGEGVRRGYGPDPFPGLEGTRGAFSYVIESGAAEWDTEWTTTKSEKHGGLYRDVASQYKIGQIIKFNDKHYMAVKGYRPGVDMLNFGQYIQEGTITGIKYPSQGIPNRWLCGVETASGQNPTGSSGQYLNVISGVPGMRWYCESGSVGSGASRQKLEQISYAFEGGSAAFPSDSFHSISYPSGGGPGNTDVGGVPLSQNFFGALDGLVPQQVFKVVGPGDGGVQTYTPTNSENPRDIGTIGWAYNEAGSVSGNWFWNYPSTSPHWEEKSAEWIIEYKKKSWPWYITATCSWYGSGEAYWLDQERLGGTGVSGVETVRYPYELYLTEPTGSGDCPSVEVPAKYWDLRARTPFIDEVRINVSSFTGIRPTCWAAGSSACIYNVKPGPAAIYYPATYIGIDSTTDYPKMLFTGDFGEIYDSNSMTLFHSHTGCP